MIVPMLKISGFVKVGTWDGCKTVVCLLLYFLLGLLAIFYTARNFKKFIHPLHSSFEQMRVLTTLEHSKVITLDTNCLLPMFGSAHCLALSSDSVHVT